MEHVERIGEMRNAYKILFWKPEKKRDLTICVDVRIILELS